MKSNNALVTYNDLTTMGLTAKTSAPTGTRVATKSFINTYYYVDNRGTFSTYPNNRCVPYQYITGSVPNSGTMYYSSSSGNNYYGFGSSSAACTHTSGGSVTVYWYGTLGAGTILFADTSGTYIMGNANYFSINGYNFQMDGNTISSYNPCAVNSNWSWTNNNVVESPPFGGGYISISVNGSNIVNQPDFGSSIVTYTGSFSVSIGDTVSVTVYSYANNTFGTQSTLTIQNPNGTTIFNSSDTNPSPGSASSISYSWTATSGGITINGYSNSY